MFGDSFSVLWGQEDKSEFTMTGAAFARSLTLKTDTLGPPFFYRLGHICLSKRALMPVGTSILKLVFASRKAWTMVTSAWIFSPCLKIYFIFIEVWRKESTPT